MQVACGLLALDNCGAVCLEEACGTLFLTFTIYEGLTGTGYTSERTSHNFYEVEVKLA